ncbi:hypothetical protein JW960_22280 [candidate division KSB1 bacterium]|nr:hypothetical protein [candidate division KSB1 bacterium]
MKKKVLFICGSMNQTTQMHQIADELVECDNYFTPHYATGFVDVLRKFRLAEMSVIGYRLANRCLEYLKLHNLSVDYGGRKYDYDLVVTCADLIVQKNIRDKKVILVQEGMVDPINFVYHLIKKFPFLPHWWAGTNVAGLNDQYIYFCVASDGYRDLFVERGVNHNKIRITGIPNFDNCRKYYDNDFPHRDYVLVCTSDFREKYRYENRKQFIRQALEIANGRQLFFKLHPSENHTRAEAEIKRWAPDALVYKTGSAEEMVANCQTFITRFSSTVLVAAALGKETVSDIDPDELKVLAPVQHAKAAKNIADVCRELLNLV